MCLTYWTTLSAHSWISLAKPLGAQIIELIVALRLFYIVFNLNPSLGFFPHSMTNFINDYIDNMQKSQWYRNSFKRDYLSNLLAVCFLIIICSLELTSTFFFFFGTDYGRSLVLNCLVSTSKQTPPFVSTTP